MNSRRDFLKTAALLAAGGSMAGALPAAIQKALAIDPPKGSTFLDAEHVVILMQENRSFDHAYGALRGVRGFNDPRAVSLPNGNPVWLQSNAAGDTYAPFHLDIAESKSTWMGSLPHSWTDQVDARHEGKHDGWLESKRLGAKESAHIPFTMGHYDRKDLPFYYALADAFTICDQNFCSSLTGTTPNRLYLWTGTIREQPTTESKANVRNEDVDYGREAKWTTFPERLEKAGISWRVYQNEISFPSGLDGDEDSWLSNFTDNPLEWFTQYNVRFSGFRHNQAARIRALESERTRLGGQPKPLTAEVEKQIQSIGQEIERIRKEMETWSEANFAKLPEHNQNLHRKCFTTNEGDPNYRQLKTLNYKDGNTERQMKVPKGDLFYQFRKDVQSGKLPTVSWLVAPANFSDHPGAPWYGAWYVSEALDILTQNPEVWRKTIFILCYDENDGIFDHVPPFVAPQPGRPETGLASAGIDLGAEYVGQAQEVPHQGAGRTGPIGLGYRVPLVIASPWSRGGYVCSQVFDHTSILQFLEKFLTQKTGRPVRETNISDWRRTVCGDLTAVFRPWNGEKVDLPKPVDHRPFLQSIHKAQFKPLPEGFKKLSAEEIAQTRKNPRQPWMPQQEKGVRPACPLPYELAAHGALSEDRKSFNISFAAGKTLFGERAAGAPFRVYAPVPTRPMDKADAPFEPGRCWDYAVSAGDKLTGSWPITTFEQGTYHLRVHGPNGFYREYRGTANDPAVEIKVALAPIESSSPAMLAINVVTRETDRPVTVLVDELSYGQTQHKVTLARSANGQASANLKLDLGNTHGWYDLRIRIEGAPQFEQRCAGRIENGRESISDPLMSGEAAT